MKLWIASASVFFFLFLIFFSRRLPTQNYWFAAWLFTGVAAQTFFAIVMALNLRLGWLDTAIGALGWLLIGAALLHAHRAPGAANEIIFSGLGALVILQIVAIAATRTSAAPAIVTILASNLAGIVPAGWMLARFVWTWSDPLALLAKQVSGVGCRVSDAVGWARAMLA